MSNLPPNYLLTLRKRSGLSQADLAMLLGISASALCRLEFRSRRPTLELAMGAEIILGHRLKDLFPDAYETIQRGIVQRAQILRARYRSRPKMASRAGLRLLDDIVERARQTTLDL